MIQIMCFIMFLVGMFCLIKFINNKQRDELAAISFLLIFFSVFVGIMSR